MSNLKEQLKKEVLEKSEEKRLHYELSKTVERKFKYERAKGTRIILETISLMLLLASSIFKANIISFFYTIIVIYYLLAYKKVNAMTVCVFGIGLCFST